MIRAAAALFRVKLSLLNGSTALAGYLLFPDPVAIVTAGAVFAGVTLLAAGGSAVNQAMEHELDARMSRTCMRPVPQRKFSRSSAHAAGGFAILTGLALLISGGGAVPALAGGAALAWYLMIYTPLKARTSLALPVGALCGAFPPLIGWSAAGGELADYRAMTLAGLFFLWQIPHFLLLQRRHAADYRRAGLPLLPSRLSCALSVDACFLLWLGTFCLATLLLPLFGIITGPAAIGYALFPLPVALLVMFRSDKRLFSCINSYPLLVVLLLACQKFQFS